MRNLLGEYKTIWLPGFYVPMKWSHFESLLNRLQDELGNQITSNHIDYEKHKMKALFATQLLNGSSTTSMDED